MENIQDLLHTFDKNPNPAIIIPQKTPITISYTTLYTQVQHLQDALASLIPLHIGSRLSIILPTSFEFVAVFLAIACLRAVVVPLNPALRRGEYAACIDELGLDAVIVPKGAACERHAAVLAALDKGVEVIECGFSEGRVDLDCSYKGDQRQEVRTVPGPPGEEDVALILQTSGTTGRAKAVSMRAGYQSCC